MRDVVEHVIHLGLIKGLILDELVDGEGKSQLVLQDLFLMHDFDVDGGELGLVEVSVDFVVELLIYWLVHLLVQNIGGTGY